MSTQPDDAAGLGAALKVADAILYEGYLLYPYRRSSGRNRIRWQFGVLLPQEWARSRGLDDSGVAGSAESWWQQTECLLQAPETATVRARIRFLQLVDRSGGRMAQIRVGKPDVAPDAPSHVKGV